MIRRIEISNAVAEDGNRGLPGTLGDAWEDLPEEHRGLLSPRGWLPTRNGWSYGNTPTLSCRIYIGERSRDIISNRIFYKILWYDGRKWHGKTVQGKVLARSYDITDLADFGLPVTSTNAKDYVDFFDGFKHANENTIPHINHVSHFGWIHSSAQTLFLMDDRCLSGGDSQGDTVYRADDQGADGYAQALREGGEWGEWKEVLAIAEQHPVVALAICASCAAPLLHILDLPTFWVSFAGKTTGGKTTTLRIAASVWGANDPHNTSSLVTSWNASAVGMERIATTACNIPVFLDDTSAGRPDIIADAIYTGTAGRGKTRGTLTGLATTGVWRTVFCSTGEQSLLDYSCDGGTAARVIEVWGLPFGDDAELGRSASARAMSICSVNYGHLGPRFVQQLLENKGSWPQMKERHTQIEQEIINGSESINEVASRRAKCQAIIELTSVLLREYQLIGIDFRSQLRECWNDSLRDASAESDRPREALISLVSSCNANINSFYIQGTDVEAQPPGGWWGIRRGGHGGDTYFGVEAQRANKILEEQGFKPREQRRLWRDREWTICNANRTSLKARLGNNSVDVIAIRSDVIAVLMAE